MVGLTQRIHELSIIQLEAINANNRLVADACGRVKTTLHYMGYANADDCSIVQRYIGSRTQQNRYGQ